MSEDVRREMHGGDRSNWLYQGNAAGDRPADLGISIGYRIAQGYLESAEKEREAVRRLLTLED